jgi:hypothetical protein
VYVEEQRIEDGVFSFSSTLEYDPGQQRLVLLGFAGDGGSTPGDATYGSVGMHVLREASADDYRVKMYYLLEDDLGSYGVGSYTVSVTMSGAQGQRGHAVAFYCRNILQTIPDSKSSATGSGTSNTVSFTAGENPSGGSWMLSHIYYAMGAVGSPSDFTLIDARQMTNHHAGAAYGATGGGAFSSEWTWGPTNANSSVQVVALLEPGTP